MPIAKPVMLEGPVDLTAIREAAQDLVDDAWDEDTETAESALLHRTDNYREAIFEAVMTTLFGPNFFDESYTPRGEEVDDATDSASAT
jgi:hypothetical protein